MSNRHSNPSAGWPLDRPQVPSPEAFKQALEQRLRAVTKTGAAFARKRQLLVFDRFLARIVQVLGDTPTLKGGLVLELRLDRARTTKDIDLRLTGPSDGVLPRLQEARGSISATFSRLKSDMSPTTWRFRARR